MASMIASRILCICRVFCSNASKNDFKMGKHPGMCSYTKTNFFSTLIIFSAILDFLSFTSFFIFFTFYFYFFDILYWVLFSSNIAQAVAQRCSVRKGVPKNFAIFTGKHLGQSFSGTGVFL